MMDKNTYIRKAQDVYEGIVNNHISVYGFFIRHTLNDFDILFDGQLKILQKLLSVNEAPFLQMEIINGQIEDISFKDTRNDCKERTKNTVIIDIEGGCCKDNEKAIIHKNLNRKNKNSKNFGWYTLLATSYIWHRREDYHLAPEYCTENKIREAEDCVLECILKRSFLEFCVEYTCTYNKEGIYYYCDAITILFFNYLWKSLSLGEFYIVPKYEEILQTIKDTDADQLADKKLPAFINYYADIVTSVATFSNRINPPDLNGLYDVYIELDEDIIVDYIADNYVQTQLLRPLIRITQLIFEITIIDLKFTASSTNLNKLINLIYALKNFKDSLSSKTIPTATQRINVIFDDIFVKSFGVSKQDIENTVDGLIYKASVLAQQMMIQPKSEKQICFDQDQLSNIQIKKIIDTQFSYKNYYQINTLHTFIKKDDSLPSIDHKKYPQQINDIFDNDKRLLRSSLITDYDQNIQKGILLYLDDQQLLNSLNNCKDIKKTLNKIQKFIKKYTDDKINDYKSLSPFTLVYTIEWLYQLIIQEKDDVTRDSALESNLLDAIALLGELLSCLRKFNILYGIEDVIPYQIRPYFKQSFYQINTEQTTVSNPIVDTQDLKHYDCSKFKDFVFIESLGYKPINMSFLKNIFRYYNREHRALEGELLKKSIAMADNLQEQNKSTLDAVQNERGRTLQLVGLLGTFIAFVSSFVGMQKVADEILEFVLFGVTFLIGMLIFVIGIHYITQQKKSGWLNFFLSVVVILLILITAQLAIHFLPEDKQESNSTQCSMIDSTKIHTININTIDIDSVNINTTNTNISSKKSSKLVK